MAKRPKIPIQKNDLEKNAKCSHLVTTLPRLNVNDLPHGFLGELSREREGRRSLEEEFRFILKPWLVGGLLPVGFRRGANPFQNT